MMYQSMYEVTIRESRPWNGETLRYDDGPVTYTVFCPAHRKVYEGTDQALATARLAEHDGHVPVQDENWAFAFTTVAGRHHVSARFMRPDDLYRTHGGRKTRTYVGSPAAEVEAATGLVAPPYGSQRGDGSAEDAAWRRYNRAETQVMRLKLSRVRPVLEAAFGLAPGSQFSFSRKAGCSCPCSPGFILNGQVRAPQAGRERWGTPVDIWVD